MGNGITYFGTDGNREWLERQGIPWNRATCGELARYEGENFNLQHEWKYRRNHHASILRERQLREGTPYMVEFWITGARETSVWGRHHWDEHLQLEGDDCDIETVIHHRKGDKRLSHYLAEKLSMSRVHQEFDGRLRTRYSLVPDLPSMGIRNDVVAELVLPRKPISEDFWYEAWTDLRLISATLSRAEKTF